MTVVPRPFAILQKLLYGVARSIRKSIVESSRRTSPNMSPGGNNWAETRQDGDLSGPLQGNASTTSSSGPMKSRLPDCSMIPRICLRWVCPGCQPTRHAKIERTTRSALELNEKLQAVGMSCSSVDRINPSFDVYIASAGWYHLQRSFITGLLCTAAPDRLHISCVQRDLQVSILCPNHARNRSRIPCPGGRKHEAWAVNLGTQAVFEIKGHDRQIRSSHITASLAIDSRWSRITLAQT